MVVIEMVLREVIDAVGRKSEERWRPKEIQGPYRGEILNDKMNENAGSAGAATVERSRGNAGFIVMQSGEASAIPWSGVEWHAKLGRQRTGKRFCF